VAAFANGLTSSNEKALHDQLNADYVVTANSIWQKLPYSAAGAIASAPGVRVASSLVADRARMRGDNVDVYGADPKTIAGPYRFQWTDGSDASVAALGRHGAVVRKAFADRYEVNVGSRVTLLTAAGKQLRLVVRGVYDPGEFAPMLGSVLVSTAAFGSAFPRPKLDLALVQGGPQTRASLERALRGYPDATVRTVDDYVAASSADLKTILNLLYVLLALSGLVSLLGMINTLALAVFERTRELGMLRAIGMTRRQARRMVRHESVITGLIGAALGIPLGVGLAAIVTRALAPYGLQFSLPVGPVAMFVVVAIASGLLAAILPARRASRLNILRALQYE
jgi:putative ABC transport system permease protein